MKEKISYKSISNWSLASDFYHTWREVFLLIKENQNEFYMWHNFNNKNLEVKLLSINNFMSIKFKPVGFISKDLNDNINTIKFKRGKHYNRYDNEPTFTIKHTFKDPNRFQYYNSRPYLTSMDEMYIPNYQHYNDIDTFVNTLEQLFNKINLTDKKRIYRGTQRWKKRKDKWSAISFWKCINGIFTIKFNICYRFDEKLKPIDKYKHDDYKIFIDVKERYNMEAKSVEWLIAKRKAEAEKRKQLS
jgi:hypothetical protein